MAEWANGTSWAHSPKYKLKQRHATLLQKAKQRTRLNFTSPIGFLALRCYFLALVGILLNHLPVTAILYTRFRVPRLPMNTRLLSHTSTDGG